MNEVSFLDSTHFLLICPKAPQKPFSAPKRTRFDSPDNATTMKMTFQRNFCMTGEKVTLRSGGYSYALLCVCANYYIMTLSPREKEEEEDFPFFAWLWFFLLQQPIKSTSRVFSKKDFFGPREKSV